MKTQEELNILKEEVESLNRKLAELTDEEIAQVSGGYVTVRDGKPVWEHSNPVKDDYPPGEPRY